MGPGLHQDGRDGGTGLSEPETLKWLLIGLGGAIGSLARHGVNVLVARLAGQATHHATAVVNVTGCALIGLLAGSIASGRLTMTPSLRLFVFVGVLGGFTTFSSFGLDTFALAREGRRTTAVWNVAIQVVVGLSAVAAGYVIALRTAVK